MREAGESGEEKRRERGMVKKWAVKERVGKGGISEQRDKGEGKGREAKLGKKKMRKRKDRFECWIWKNR